MRVSSDNGSPFVGGGGTSIQYVYDGVSVKAVDGPNRLLKDAASNTILDFKNKTTSSMTLKTLFMMCNDNVNTMKFYASGNSDLSLVRTDFAFASTMSAGSFVSGGGSLTNGTGLVMGAFPIIMTDTGIKRNAAGVLKITDGASGTGNIIVNNQSNNSLALSGNDGQSLIIAGSQSAPSDPITPAAYISVRVSGTDMRIPCYI